MTGRLVTEAVLDGDRWLAADRGRLWEPALVVATEPSASQTTTLRLRLPEIPAVLPGQYYLIRLVIDAPPGIVEQAYSVSSSPYPPTPEIEIAVREVPGGRVSPHLVHDVRVGDRLYVRGPFGFLTWTEKDGGPLVLIGAGSGVAPLMSIVRYAAARRAAVPMTVLCSSRDRPAVFLRHALEALDRDQPWLSVAHTFTRSPGDPYARYHRRIDAAMIDEVVRRAPGTDAGEASFLVAGPSDLVASVRRALGALDVPDARTCSEDHA